MNLLYAPSTLLYAATASGLVAIILEFVAKKDTNNAKRSNGYSVCIVVFIALSLLANCKRSGYQDSQNDRIELNLGAAKRKIDTCITINKNLDSINIKMGIDLSDIKTAIKNANYYYDSNQKKIITIKSQINATINGGNNQFGNGNNQDN